MSEYGSTKAISLFSCPTSYRVIQIKDINQIEYLANTNQNICYDTEVILLSWNRGECRTDMGEFKVKFDSATGNFYYEDTEETKITKKEPKKKEKKVAKKTEGVSVDGVLIKIPVHVHILEIDEKRYKTKTKPKHIESQFKKANKVNKNKTV